MKNVLAAALVAAVLATPASAQTDQVRVWSLSCGQGALGCISWSVRFQYDPNRDLGYGGLVGGTQVTATVTNRQGRGAFTDFDPYGTGGWYLGGIEYSPAYSESCDCYRTDEWGLARVTTTGEAGDVNVATPEVVTPLSNARSDWEWTAVPGSFFISEWISETHSVYGCEGAPQDHPIWNPSRWFQTCGGSLTFDATVAGQLAFSEESHVRIPGGTPTVLVPEPGTYMLLLAGVLGLGVVARRRTAFG